jgi:alpha-beta hydrolase superfamily lysophospholipase
MGHTLLTPFGETVITAPYRTFDPANETVFIAPGFTNTSANTSALVDSLTSSGYNAFTHDQPRETPKELEPIDPIDRQAAVTLAVIEREVPEGTKVHALAHSLGSAAVLRAAIARPELFTSITINEPVGLNGKRQGIVNLMSRSALKNIKNVIGARHGQTIELPKQGYAARVDIETAKDFRKRTIKAQAAAGKLALKNLKLTMREARAAGAYEIDRDLEKVTDLGIPVHILLANKDELFKSKNTYRKVKDIKATSISSIADPNAGHDSFWRNPKLTTAIFNSLNQ